MSMRYAGCVLTLTCVYSKGLYSQSHWTLVHLTLSRGIWSLAIPAPEHFCSPAHACRATHLLKVRRARLRPAAPEIQRHANRQVKRCCMEFYSEVADSGQAACRWMPRPIDEHEARKSFLLHRQQNAGVIQACRITPR